MVSATSHYGTQNSRHYHTSAAKKRSSEAAKKVLNLPQNARYLFEHEGVVSAALAFSLRPKSLSKGWEVGSDKKRCDLVIHEKKSVEGISSIHFRINWNWNTGCLLVLDQSSHGTNVYSATRGQIPLHGTITPIFANDTIQAGLVMFRLIIPPRENFQEAYDRKWRAYRQEALDTFPELRDLNIHKRAPGTLKDSGKLSLLTSDLDLEDVKTHRLWIVRGTSIW
jgi:hypothetical protein